MYYIPKIVLPNVRPVIYISAPFHSDGNNMTILRYRLTVYLQFCGQVHAMYILTLWLPVCIFYLALTHTYIIYKADVGCFCIRKASVKLICQPVLYTRCVTIMWDHCRELFIVLCAKIVFFYPADAAVGRSSQVLCVWYILWIAFDQ